MSPLAPATTTKPSTTAGLATNAPAEGLAFHASENGAPAFSSLARPRPSSRPSDGQSLATAAGAAQSTSVATRQARHQGVLIGLLALPRRGGLRADRAPRGPAPTVGSRGRRRARIGAPAP